MNGKKSCVWPASSIKKWMIHFFNYGVNGYRFWLPALSLLPPSLNLYLSLFIPSSLIVKKRLIELKTLIDESEKKRGSWFGCDGPRTYNQQPATKRRNVFFFWVKGQHTIQPIPLFFSQSKVKLIEMKRNLKKWGRCSAVAPFHWFVLPCSARDER